MAEKNEVKTLLAKCHNNLGNELKKIEQFQAAEVRYELFSYDYNFSCVSTSNAICVFHWIAISFGSSLIGCE